MENLVFFMVYLAIFGGALHLFASIWEKVSAGKAPKALSESQQWMMLLGLGALFFGGLFAGDRWLNGPRDSSSYSSDDDFYEPCTGSMRC